MKFDKTREESLADKALLLALLSKVQSKNRGRIGDRLKMQKLSFLLCYRLFERRLKGLNYVYFTYRWGPFTKDIYEAEADFEEANLLARRGKYYRLTESGEALGNAIAESMNHIQSNAPILQVLDEVVTEFATWPTDQLIAHTHKMKVLPVGWHEACILESLPMNLDLTAVLDNEESVTVLKIDTGWLKSFGAALEGPGAQRPSEVTDSYYWEAYASAARGLEAEKAGEPAIEVSWAEGRRLRARR